MRYLEQLDALVIHEKYEHTFVFETDNLDIDYLDEGSVRLLFNWKVKALKDLLIKGNTLLDQLPP